MCDAGCASHYRCQNGQCMKRSTICDKSVCRSSCTEDDGWKIGTGFKCTRNGQTCRLPQQLLWDNVKDCDDGSDICYQSNISVSDGRWTSFSTVKWILFQKTFYIIKTLVIFRDIRTLPSTSFNPTLCFQCLDESMIIPRKLVCNGIVDCSDLSDECLCPRSVPSVCKMVQNRVDQQRWF